MKTVALSSVAGLAAGVSIQKVGDQSNITLDMQTKLAALETQVTALEDKLHPALNHSVDSIIDRMNAGQLVLANNNATAMLGDEKFAEAVMKFATDKKNHALLMKKLHADRTGTKLKLDTDSWYKQAEFDMKWDLTSSIGIAMNLEAEGSIYERVDLPANTFTMQIEMRAPGDEGSDDWYSDEFAMKGYFTWGTGVYVLYNPLSVSTTDPNSHRRFAVQSLLEAGMPNMDEAARAYSLLERTGDIAKLTEPAMFEKAVRQLLLLEKFRENPMALKRLVELSNEQHTKPLAEPTSFAQDMTHVNNRKTKSALRMMLPGIALEPFTNIGFKTAFIGANDNSDPMVLDINGALIEGAVFKPGSSVRDMKNTMSLALSMGYYSYAGEDDGLTVNNGDKWETSFGSLRGSHYTIDSEFYSAMPGSIGCRLFTDMSMACGIPFFNFHPPKVCLNCS